MSNDQQRSYFNVSPRNNLIAITLLLLLGCFAETSAQWTNGTDISNTNSGNVGIGTPMPTALLEIRRSQNAGTTVIIDNPFTTNPNSAYSGIFLKQGGANRFFLGSINDNNNIHFGGSGAVQFWNFTNAPILFSTNNAEAMRLTGAGNLGIGTASPTERLEVNGNIKVSGTISAKYQDVAEWVDSAENLSAGTVVVLDATRPNHVIASTAIYDTRVAGVISARPGITLGEHADGKVLVATTGRVKVRVSAKNGPINIGDLLVSSDKQGVAMKSNAVRIGSVRMHRPGTLIGKALEPLARGTGEILVLLSLQ